MINELFYLEPMTFDAKLPADIKKLFKPLFCELCNVVLNSPVTAKCHYESKVHERKVRYWLDDWSKRTGLPVPEIKSVNSLNGNAMVQLN